MKQKSHFFDGFLEWQEVVASEHVCRETGPTFFFGVAGGGGIRTCVQRDRSHFFLEGQEVVASEHVCRETATERWTECEGNITSFSLNLFSFKLLLHGEHAVRWRVWLGRHACQKVDTRRVVSSMWTEFSCGPQAEKLA